MTPVGRVAEGIKAVLLFGLAGLMVWGIWSSANSKDQTKPQTVPIKALQRPQEPPFHDPYVNGRIYFVVDELPGEELFVMWAHRHCRTDCPELAKEQVRDQYGKRKGDSPTIPLREIKEYTYQDGHLIDSQGFSHSARPCSTCTY